VKQAFPNQKEAIRVAKNAVVWFRSPVVSFRSTQEASALHPVVQLAALQPAESPAVK
jgi:hypothetical protein